MTSSPPASGARSRTRQAILDAAIRVLGRRPGASLSEVATAAEVGRTTLHRYFASRQELLDAVSVEALSAVGSAFERAGLAEGTGRETVLRALRELLDLRDVLTLVFTGIFLDRPEWQEGTEPSGELVEVVRRGHADGSISPALSALWVENLLWCLLYAADSYANVTGGSRHDALAMATRSLDGALRPDR
ncbi:TetR/AcrR family transcriptional regulator [Motilibacter aurantiacus]|uniref:TetR/AcrR family transcriptional regulator n=1 Tax=Motilibacter aurantiacus TaxID=2714955 RepID=UPI00140E3143|nr:TetR/AcrR family transcriptional regulator [Motilibacter aurantiacus]